MGIALFSALQGWWWGEVIYSKGNPSSFGQKGRPAPLYTSGTVFICICPHLGLVWGEVVKFLPIQAQNKQNEPTPNRLISQSSTGFPLEPHVIQTPSRRLAQSTPSSLLWESSGSCPTTLSSEHYAELQEQLLQVCSTSVFSGACFESLKWFF